MSRKGVGGGGVGGSGEALALCGGELDDGTGLRSG